MQIAYGSTSEPMFSLKVVFTHTFRPWRHRQYVLPNCRWIPTRLHGVILILRDFLQYLQTNAGEVTLSMLLPRLFQLISHKNPPIINTTYVIRKALLKDLICGHPDVLLILRQIKSTSYTSVFIKYRICSRNLRTFFLFWPLKNRGAENMRIFFLWRSWSGFYSSILVVPRNLSLLICRTLYNYYSSFPSWNFNTSAH
jgi:hypothetical protein